MEWTISDYMYVWWVPAYWHYQLAWRTTHNTLIFSITAQRTSSRNNEIALFMSDCWEPRADVSFSMNFRATDATPCIELLSRMQESGWGVSHPERKARAPAVANCPQMAGTLPRKSTYHIRGEHSFVCTYGKQLTAAPFCYRH